MEEQKVRIEVPIDVYRTIEKAKEKASKMPHFEWVRYLGVEEFMEVLFGLSEVSKLCRETFLKSFDQVRPEELVAPPKAEGKTMRTKAQKASLELTAVQSRVVDAMKKAGMPLAMAQIAQLSGLKKSTVNSALYELSQKGAVERVVGSHLWKLREGLDFTVHKTVSERILELLKSAGRPLSTSEVAARLGEKRSTVSSTLWELFNKEAVHRVSNEHNRTLWMITGGESFGWGRESVG